MSPLPGGAGQLAAECQDASESWLPLSVKEGTDPGCELLVADAIWVGRCSEQSTPIYTDHLLPLRR